MTELYFTDFFKAEPNLPDRAFDMIALDMPYGQFRDKKKLEHLFWDERPDLYQLVDDCDRLLKFEGYLVVFGNRDLLDTLSGYLSREFKMRDEYVWAKPGNLPSNTLKPIPVHEFIHVYMNKNQQVSKLTWNPRVLPGEPYIRKGTAGKISTRRQRKSAFHQNTSGMRHIRSVLEAPNKPAMKSWESKGMRHPTMKPVSLLAQLIRAYTNPGDWILDPFAGSGSLSLASFLTGRNSKAFENDSVWFHEAAMRLNRVKDMLGPDQVEHLHTSPERKTDDFDITSLYS
jgi:site-specific DNA-methyltransferase (adenine-specific)